jgi:RHS repeat-associated protein
VLNRAIGDGPGFTGHVEDSATGLTYMQQRYYDPLGLFPTVDPVTAFDNGDWRHFNRYAYAYNNPYGYTDPDGRIPLIIPVVAGVAWLLTSGDANAPMPGETTRSMSAGDAVGKFAEAIPAGRIGVGVKIGVNEWGEAAKGAKTAGRYEFPDKRNDNKTYVGQSCNCERRLGQHETAGRLEPGTAKVTPVEGGKTAREISEHNRIQEITGGVPARNSDAVSNKVDPIGASRRHLLDED